VDIQTDISVFPGFHSRSFAGENELAQLMATAWQLTLSLIVDREYALVRKSLPTDVVFKVRL